MTLPRLRRLFLDVHLWIGAGLALVLVPLGVTGSLLVYRAEIDRLVSPERYAVTAGPLLPPSAYVAAAEGADKAARVVQLRYPAQSGTPLQAMIQLRGAPGGGRPSMRTVYLDPPTANVLDIADPRAGVFGWAHEFHETLMVPGSGRQIVGWLGVAMTLSCLTGIYLWWPRGGTLIGALRWRRSQSGFSNLHHFAGFWILVPLAAVSLTGVYIGFPQTARGLTARILPMSASARGGPGGRGAPVAPYTDIDEAARAAQSLAQGLALDSVSMPAKIAGRPAVWRIGFRGPGAQPVMVEVDDATGAPRMAAAPPAGDRTAAFIRQLHAGRGLGPVWRALAFLAGIAPALLATTGIVLWLARRSKRRAAAKAAALAAAE